MWIEVKETLINNIMKVSPDYYDEIFEFKGQWNMPSSCGLKIRKIKEVFYIIVTELYQENPGTSVTYAGESLKRQICEQKGLRLDEVIYIECTPDTNSKLSFYDEEYYVVDFSKDIAHRYRQLTSEEIKLIMNHKVIEK